MSLTLYVVVDHLTWLAVIRDGVLFQPSRNGSTTAFRTELFQAMCYFQSWVRYPLRIPPDTAGTVDAFYLWKVVFDDAVAEYWQRLPAEEAKGPGPALTYLHRGPETHDGHDWGKWRFYGPLSLRSAPDPRDPAGPHIAPPTVARVVLKGLRCDDEPLP